MEQLGIDKFKIPETSLLTYNQLLDLFTNNLKVRDHLIEQMMNADNKYIYDLYKKAYDALMISEYSDKFFTLPDGTIADTYYDYLVSRDSTLAASIESIRAINDDSSKREVISEYISQIIYALEEYINGDSYKYLFAGIPTVSGDAMKKYVSKVINFFKSYKVTILDINTIYVFNDKYENLARAIDKMEMTMTMKGNDFVGVQDKMSIIMKMILSNKDSIYKDKVYIDIDRIIDIIINDKYSIEDTVRFAYNMIANENQVYNDTATITQNAV